MGRAAACTTHDQRCVPPPPLRRLQTLHEGLAQSFGEALSSMLRTAIDTNVAGVDQTAYGRFVQSLPGPRCFCVVKADPWDDRLMLDVAPEILHPMIDRLLGGPGVAEPPPNRSLTEVELSLAARIVSTFLHECSRAWRESLDLKLDLKLDLLQIESNPRLLRILPADEAVIVVDMVLAVGASRGSIRLCLPGRLIDRIERRSATKPRTPLAETAAAPTLEVRVTLAETQIAAAELADLRPGDVISTETPLDAPATVAINGEARFRAKPGVFHGRKAALLVEEIQHNDDA